MVGVETEVGEEQRLGGWLRAPAVWLDRDKHSIDLRNRLCVIELQHPALLVGIILIEEAEADSVLPVGSVASPRLKCAGLPDTPLLVEIVAVEDE